MPLKVSSNQDSLWVTWTSPDEDRTSTFRIRKTDPDEEVLKKLVRLTRFIASQMDEQTLEIAELELAIRGTAAPTQRLALEGVDRTTGTTATTSLTTPALGPSTADPNAPKILMTPPASLSDQPAGGPPPISTFGWGSMPTVSVPAELAAPAAGGWEMIPPEELME